MMIKENMSDKLFDIINNCLLFMFLFVVLYPLIYIFSASLSSPNAVISGRVWLYPVEINFTGYAAVFQHKFIVTGFKNSFIYTALGTFINVAFTLLAAYPLSRKDFRGRGFIMFLFVFTMLFNGGLIPTYLLVRDLNMLNTVWAMVIPGALAVYYVIITRTFFQMSLPDELLEASRMDGCSDFNFFFRIAIPLSGPVIATIALFYAVGHWNQFFAALIYLRDQSLFPLQLVLRDILIQNEVDTAMLMMDLEEMQSREGLRELLKYSLIVVATLPVLIIYPFAQKYFVKGVMIGSLKG